MGLARVDSESEGHGRLCEALAEQQAHHPALIALSKTPLNEFLMQFIMLLLHFAHDYNGMANATITTAITVR